MVTVTRVIPHTRAERAGVMAEDILTEINGNEIKDVLDYRFYLAERRVELSLLREGKPYSVTIRKGEYDDIGLEFATPLMDKKQTCKNKCIFCFIDQNPAGMRDTIYFKDDDSRLSFLHGNYITLTNMSDEDVERIVKMRFSPINVSIHTLNPELRVKMMKNKRAGEVLKYLTRFKEAGLSIAGQIVLCKGVNDGEELQFTMDKLREYFPSLSSVSIVPAGLTKFRDNLYPLSDFTEQEAAKIIDTVEAVAAKNRKEIGTGLFFLADEFYLKAKRELPKKEYYEGYPQIENGVGMLRSILDEFEIAYGDLKEVAGILDGKRRVAVATGVAAYPTIKSLSQAIMSVNEKINVDVYEIKNNFYGESITVSGLLTGKDIYEQLKGRLDADELLIPASALRQYECDFLCGMTLSELQDKLGIKIRAVSNDGFEFVDAVIGREN